MIERASRFNLRRILQLFGVVIVGIGILMAISTAGNFFYFFNTVEAQEIGIQFRQGRIYQIVDPGVYSDFGLFVKLETISTQAISYQTRDEEIITKDKQRIGLMVSGDIFRPTNKDTIRNLWPQYRGMYTGDETAINRVNDLTRQAMKVCVGERTFDNNIIGSARDELRACIDSELNKLASRFGLLVENVVVPEVILSAEVQTALDAIVQSRLLTEKAAQDELKALAEAAAEQARQEGEIRVAQSRIQEETRQQTQLAQLERERLAAQLSLIEARRNNELAEKETDRQLIEAGKANDLLAAQLDVEINRELAEAALAKAEADVAFESTVAQLYAANPVYVQWMMAQANASALNATDKVIFTPEGTVPTLVLPGPGIVPTVDTTPPSAESQ
jgi:hypothetical protein